MASSSLEGKRETDPFTIFEAGPFHHVLKRVSIADKPGVLALLSILGTWLPVCILTIYEGTFRSGVSLTFVDDIALHSRMLLAMPLLVLIRPVVNKKVTEVVRYIAQALLSPDDQVKMQKGTFPILRKMASSFWTDLIILLLVLISAISVIRGGIFNEVERGISSWMISGEADSRQWSKAGLWALAISLPMFQFLLLRWLWRYLIWMILVYKFASRPLNLLPSHADRAGGLGLLVLAQRSFNMVFMACSIVISGQLIMKIIGDPAAFSLARTITIGFVLMSLFLVILPLFFFMGQLVRVKQNGLLHFSYLATAMSRRFEKDWLNTQPIEKRIEDRQVDPSMAYDYSSMFDNLQQMRAAPVTIRDMVGLALVVVIPFLPILFVHFSALEILQKILEILM